MEKFLVVKDWISIEDRIPALGEFVLGIDKDETQEVCRRLQYNEEVPVCWLQRGNVRVFYPTHWMPLPRSPKQEIDWED